MAAPARQQVAHDLGGPLAVDDAGGATHRAIVGAGGRLVRFAHPGLLRGTLWFIATVQFVLGIGFLFSPQGMARSLGLVAAPGWADRLFGMMAARFLAVGFGMLLAARDPARHVAWIGTMVGIQAIDWLVTLKFLAVGAVTLAQVNTAAFLPVVFIGLLAWAWPRQTARPIA